MQFLAEGIDLGTSIGTATAEITTQVGAVLPAALAVGGALIAVSIGWRVLKRFVRG